jgi:hypothetical protein
MFELSYETMDSNDFGSWKAGVAAVVFLSLSKKSRRVTCIE